MTVLSAVRRRSRRTAFLPVLAVLLALIGVVLPPSTESSHALSGGDVHAGRDEGNGYWTGSYRLDDGRIVWCAFDPDRYAPNHGPYEFGPWERSSSYVTGRGLLIEGELLARISYILATYGEIDDHDTARAVYRVLHLHTGVGFPLIPGAPSFTDDVAARADAIWEESGRFAGPYRIDEPAVQQLDGGQRLDVSVQVPRAASGEALPVSTQATINGPAVWEATSSDTLTVTSDTQQRVRATGSGPISVTVSANVPASYLLIANPLDDPLAQRVVTGGEREWLTAQATAEVRDRFQPTATSTAATWHPSGQQVQHGSGIGQPLSDLIHVSADQEWITPVGQRDPLPAVFRVDWYQSEVALPPASAPPASVEHFDRVLITVYGVSDVEARSTRTVTEPGWYYPVVSFHVADQPEPLRRWFAGDFVAGFHEEREQTIVPWIPAVSTTTSAIVDGRISDTITVIGNDPSVTLEVTSDLWLTARDAVVGGLAQAPDDAELIGTVTTRVTGDATVVSPSIDVPWSRFIDTNEWPTLYWSERIEPTASTQSWTGRHLLPEETVSLDRPTASTRTAPHVSLGDQAVDEATLTGTLPTANATESVRTHIAYSLYRFSDDGTPVCTDPIWRYDDPDALIEAGIRRSDAVQITASGFYGFRHHLTAEITAPDGTVRSLVLDEGACGADDENFAVAELAQTGVNGLLIPVVGTAGSLALVGTATVALASRRRRG